MKGQLSMAADPADNGQATRLQAGATDLEAKDLGELPPEVQAVAKLLVQVFGWSGQRLRRALSTAPREGRP